MLSSPLSSRNQRKKIKNFVRVGLLSDIIIPHIYSHCLSSLHGFVERFIHVQELLYILQNKLLLVLRTEIHSQVRVFFQSVRRRTRELNSILARPLQHTTTQASA